MPESKQALRLADEMNRIAIDNPPAVAALTQIRDTLAYILHYQERRIFFPIGMPDGSVSYVNLSQAEQIIRPSEEECQIKLISGEVISVSGKKHADAVIQAIRKEVIAIEDLPKAPQQ